MLLFLELECDLVLVELELDFSFDSPLDLELDLGFSLDSSLEPDLLEENFSLTSKLGLFLFSLSLELSSGLHLSLELVLMWGSKTFDDEVVSFLPSLSLMYSSKCFSRKWFANTCLIENLPKQTGHSQGPVEGKSVKKWENRM